MPTRALLSDSPYLFVSVRARVRAFVRAYAFACTRLRAYANEPERDLAPISLALENKRIF